MPAQLELRPIKGGTVGIVMKFFDDDNDSMIPKTLNYSLKDKYGEIVNSKEDIDVVPQERVTVPLKGDDLTPGEKNFVIKGTYDSKSLGADCLLKDYLTFIVEDVPD